MVLRSQPEHRHMLHSGSRRRLLRPRHRRRRLQQTSAAARQTAPPAAPSPPPAPLPAASQYSPARHRPRQTPPLCCFSASASRPSMHLPATPSPSTSRQTAPPHTTVAPGIRRALGHRQVVAIELRHMRQHRDRDNTQYSSQPRTSFNSIRNCAAQLQPQHSIHTFRRASVGCPPPTSRCRMIP